MAFIDKILNLIATAVVREWLFRFIGANLCWCPLNTITIPAAINIVALNIAWVMRWKKHRFGIPKAMVEVINPNWLMVERAMVSFISFFVMAHDADKNIVINPAVNKNILK